MTILIAAFIAVLIVLAALNYYLFTKVAGAIQFVNEIARTASVAAKSTTPIIYNPQICSVCHRIVVKHAPHEDGFICATCYTCKEKV